MRPDAELSWQPPHPTDLRATLWPLQHGVGDPTLQWLGQDALLARRFGDGPALLRIAARPGGEFRAQAWGAGAAEAVAAAPEICGAADSTDDFDPILPRLAAEFHRRPGLRIPRSKAVFTEFVPVVLEQKVLGMQAMASYRSLVLRYGERPPGPLAPALLRRMRVSPTPEQWRRVPSWAWHRAGVGPERSRIIVRLADRAAAMDRLAELPAADARARLEALPGIGAWTSAEIAQRAFGDADAVSVGDYHLRKKVGHALAGRDFTDDEMMAALEPWRGHRHRAVLLLLGAGPRRPARGPRVAPVDYRDF